MHWTEKLPTQADVEFKQLCDEHESESERIAKAWEKMRFRENAQPQRARYANQSRPQRYYHEDND